MQQFRDYAVQYAYPLLLAGAALVVIGLLWLIGRSLRDWKWWMILFPITLPFYVVRRIGRAAPPLWLAAFGVILASAPAAIDRLVPIDLGPRVKFVDGEKHLTLTGWDRTDYADVLKQNADATIVQMANPDVTDETLSFLAPMMKLRKLDLRGTKVTDDGLWKLSALPALRELDLASTPVTDKGVREALLPMPELKRLVVEQTAVTPAAARDWQKAKEGRRALR